MTSEPSPAVVPAAEVPTEVFASHIVRIVHSSEFVRLEFGSGGRLITLVLTPTCFRSMSRQIVEGPPPRVH
jgi:hypothetical protein